MEPTPNKYRNWSIIYTNLSICHWVWCSPDMTWLLPSWTLHPHGIKEDLTKFWPILLISRRVRGRQCPTRRPGYLPVPVDLSEGSSFQCRSSPWSPSLIKLDLSRIVSLVCLGRLDVCLPRTFMNSGDLTITSVSQKAKVFNKLGFRVCDGGSWSWHCTNKLPA